MMRKNDALIFYPGVDRSKSKPGVTLAVMANAVIHNPTMEDLNEHEYEATPVDIKNLAPIPPTKYALGRADVFPTSRRPTERALSTDSDEAIERWFWRSQIHIGPVADSPERLAKAKRLFYTWRECFAESLRDAKATDLIEHSIDLEPGAIPVTGKVP